MTNERPYPTILRPYIVCAEYVEYARAILPGGHMHHIDGHVPERTIEVIISYKAGNPMQVSQRRIPIHELTRKGLRLA